MPLGQSDFRLLASLLLNLMAYPLHFHCTFLVNLDSWINRSEKNIGKVGQSCTCFMGYSVLEKCLYLCGQICHFSGDSGDMLQPAGKNQDRVPEVMALLLFMPWRHSYGLPRPRTLSLTWLAHSGQRRRLVLYTHVAVLMASWRLTSTFSTLPGTMRAQWGGGCIDDAFVFF